jgi:hypothetical protein
MSALFTLVAARLHCAKLLRPMRALPLVLLVALTSLTDCGGRATQPGDEGPGGEGGKDSSTESGTGESGGAATGGKGSGGRGGSTGGEGGKASGGASGAGGSGSDTRTLELYFHNDGDDVIYIQIHANFCEELEFAYVAEDEPDIIFDSLGSVATFGAEYGFIECTAEGSCSYVRSEPGSMPVEIVDEDTAYYRRVLPGETLGLYLRGLKNEDIEHMQTINELLYVLSGGFRDRYSGWICEENGEDCDCFVDFCAVPEARTYYGHEPDSGQSCLPGLTFVEQAIDWDSDPIRMDLKRW